jgi:hypothetical protein
MTKRIDSPVAKFPGYVLLPDFLILPQVRTFEDALDTIDEIRKDAPKDSRVFISKLDAVYLPVILSIVAEWHIEGLPDKPMIESFPLTPRKATADLIAWLVDEIRRMWIGEIEIPNA